MLSIVICTRNRPAFLMRCLETLTEKKDSFEVLVVDQSDVPVALPEDPRCRRIATRELGLAAGRNKGICAAAGNVVAFVDDDTVPDSDYVRTLEEIFNRDVNLAAVAGRILTLEDGHPYTRLHDSTARELCRNDWPRFMGGNFAIRREVAEKVGPFDERFGAGRRWASGEETDYFFRLLYQNYRVVYGPSIIVRHPREAVDAAPRELRTKLLAYGRGQGAVIAHHLIDFDNYRMFILLIWVVVKSCLRVVQNAFILRPRSALLHATVALGKCIGFFEFIQSVGRGRRVHSE